MADAIARRQISSRDAVEACLARMAAVNPRLNAVTVDLSAPARAAADRADAAVARGDALGPLHGVPVTVKENVDQAGCATTNGIVAFRDLVAAEDSPVVANWTAAGAIIVGRTNTPGFSLRLDTENDLRGRTWNPWSETHTPGGSSGGAASSVAAGITPLAHGNDIAGSVRYPAYACGLAGLRPSFGRVPAFNPSAPSERSISSQLMSVQGPLARTVRDIRLALATMARRDLRDPWWVDAPLEGPPLPGPIRVAVVTEPEALAGQALHPTVAQAMRQAADWLAEAGYEIVDERTPGFTRPMELWYAMQLPEIRAFLSPAIEQYRGPRHPPRDAAGVRRVQGRRRRAAPEGAGGAGRRRACVATVLRAGAVGAGAGVHAAGLLAGLRPGERRAHPTGVARVRHAHRPAGAGHPGPGRADRRGGRAARPASRCWRRASARTCAWPLARPSKHAPAWRRGCRSRSPGSRGSQRALDRTS